MTVLIITRSDDNHCVNTVMDKLAARGHKTFRFDSDRFPGEVLLSERHASNGDIITLDDPAQGAPGPVGCVGGLVSQAGGGGKDGSCHCA
jgi:hypothetical protein